MTDICPLCGSPVEVVSSDEGTQHYRPVLRGVCGDQQNGCLDGYLCSLPAGHSGQHRAVRPDGTDYAAWPAAPESESA